MLSCPVPVTICPTLPKTLLVPMTFRTPKSSGVPASAKNAPVPSANVPRDNTSSAIVVVGEDEFQKFTEGFLEVGDGGFGEGAREGGGGGRLVSFEVEGGSESMPVSFSPASDSGDVGYLGDES